MTVNYAAKAAPAQACSRRDRGRGRKGDRSASGRGRRCRRGTDFQRIYERLRRTRCCCPLRGNHATVRNLWRGCGHVRQSDRDELEGAFLVFAQAAQHVADGGRIMAFSSSVLAKSFPGYGAYIASKAGVEGLVHVLANELRGRNISVNAVAPGPVGTDLFLQGKNAEQIDNFRKMSPLERLGMPEDIANLVSFLAGPEGGWINSQILRANGGFA